MLRLYDSPFSPFARKVRLVLEHKGIEYEPLDVLRPEVKADFQDASPREEVPAIDHDGIVVVNSADIVAYLDYVFPDRPVLPVDPARRVRARAWERLSDSYVDAIVVDVSLWSWANRPDEQPEGLVDHARRDLEGVYADLERDLEEGEFLVGDLSIADLALFPHLYGARFLRLGANAKRFPRVAAWLSRMAELPICRDDIERLREWIPQRAELGLEMDKIAWRGDRIEWMLARGYHDWLLGEIHADRVIWPI